jgi:hypothetical protein
MEDLYVSKVLYKKRAFCRMYLLMSISLRIGKFYAEIKYTTSLGLEVVRNFISGLSCVKLIADVKIGRPTVGAVANILELMWSY